MNNLEALRVSIEDKEEGRGGERVSFAKSIAALESKSKDVERESSREGRCEESIREEPVPSQTSKIE